MAAVTLTLKGDKELQKMLERCKSKEKIKACVMKSGATLQEYAQGNAPVDTGTLKRSIGLSMKDGGMTAEVKPSAEYAPYVELGTRFMGAQPYLRPALEKAGAEFKGNLEKVVRQETSK